MVSDSDEEGSVRPRRSRGVLSRGSVVPLSRCECTYGAASNKP